VRRDRFSPLEFAVVIGLAFGQFILGSLAALLSGGTLAETGSRQGLTDAHLHSVVLYELMAAPVIGALLYVSGWRLKDFPVGATAAGTVAGVVIFAGMWAADAVLVVVLQTLFPSMRPMLEGLAQYVPAAAPSLGAITLAVLVNPAFEEILVAGYVIEALRRRFGDTTAANVSVVIRAAYHLYQGIANLPFHVAYGLVQAYVYVRFGKLWPLIVSHALLDLVALAYYLA